MTKKQGLILATVFLASCLMIAGLFAFFLHDDPPEPNAECTFTISEIEGYRTDHHTYLPNSHEKYLILDCELKNITSEDIRVDPYEFQLDANDLKYSLKIADTGIETVHPGEKLTFALLYAVPLYTDTAGLVCNGHSVHCKMLTGPLTVPETVRQILPDVAYIYTAEVVPVFSSGVGYPTYPDPGHKLVKVTGTMTVVGRSSMDYNPLHFDLIGDGSRFYYERAPSPMVDVGLNSSYTFVQVFSVPSYIDTVILNGSDFGYYYKNLTGPLTI